MKAWMRRLKPAVTNPPVFIRKANAVISWSPRAGCSQAIFWAFHHEGLLSAAAAESHLPHRYRSQTYQRQLSYRWDLARLLLPGSSGKTLIRVTRDPKRRLLSIFRHTCSNTLVHKQAREILGFDPATQGFSLRDLDGLLSALKLTHPTTADPHLMVQSNPLWDRRFGRVITLNMDELPLNAGLNDIERDLGLPVTPFERLPVFQKLRQTHNARPRRFSGEGPIECYRFGRRETKTFPFDEFMNAPLLETMARNFYAVDYDRVASGDSAGILFQAVMPGTPRRDVTRLTSRRLPG